MSEYTYCSWCEKPVIMTTQRRNAMAKEWKVHCFCDQDCNTRFYNRLKAQKRQLRRSEKAEQLTLV
jgi:hypothetical protein